MTDPSPSLADQRAARVLAAAVTVATAVGWSSPRFTREAVAAEAGVAAGTVSNAYGGMTGLRDAVMAEAVAVGLAGIVAQGLAAGHPTARGAPADVRQAALDALV